MVIREDSSSWHLSVIGEYTADCNVGPVIREYIWLVLSLENTADWSSH